MTDAKKKADKPAAVAAEGAAGSTKIDSDASADTSSHGSTTRDPNASADTSSHGSTTRDPNASADTSSHGSTTRDITVQQLTAQGGEVELQKAELSTVHLRVARGGPEGQELVDYDVEVQEGMVVLDAIHRIQSGQDASLACRWNCKAGKCGSCSAEINGVPRLMCMTRIDELPEGPVIVEPVKTFPVKKDLVPDVSWNYRVNKNIQPFTPREMTEAEKAKGEFNMKQVDIDRVQEFRKCIECFLCQDVCHVLRDHDKMKDPAVNGGFYGPRFMIRIASLEMHPADAGDRVPQLKKEGGVGFCNITKCCTEVCPEHIKITDNGIIPMKERVVDRYYDPLALIVRAVTGRKK